MERLRTKAERWRGSDTAGASEGCEAASDARSSGSEVRYSSELGVGINLGTKFPEEEGGNGTEGVGRHAGVRVSRTI